MKRLIGCCPLDLEIEEYQGRDGNYEEQLMNSAPGIPSAQQGVLAYHFSSVSAE